ncbi:uncharacterized protein LOC116132386 [Pistacia vera]|uniref:uncharacterized protein LOC116132386 n=1 Tax=Pistacia vera TaxID=55513 RepID=UPI0012636742|nr:uncharacterized protein LOC116132386 [Pistacia vera]
MATRRPRKVNRRGEENINEAGTSEPVAPTTSVPPNSGPATSAQNASVLDEAAINRMIQTAITEAFRRVIPEGISNQVNTNPSAPVVQPQLQIPVPPPVTGPVMPMGATPSGQVEPIYNLSQKHQPPEFSGSNDPAVTEEWLETVERAMALFPMSDQEKVRYASYLLRGDARVWWKLMEHTYVTSNLSWNEFKRLFEAEYRSADMLSVKTQEFTELKQGNMTVREYATMFNSLARFAPTMVSTQQCRLERFINGLHPKIAQIVIAGGQPPQTYSEALERALRAEIYVNKERRMENPKLVIGSSSSGQTAVQKVEVGNSTQASEDKGKRKFQQGFQKKGGKNKRTSQQQQRRNNLPHCQKCGRQHKGNCLLGTNVCFKCKQPGHMAKDCKVTQATSLQTVGGSTARVYSVAQKEAEANPSAVTGKD